MNTLREEIRKLIEEDAQSRAEVRRCESAIHAVIKLVLEREPSTETIDAALYAKRGADETDHMVHIYYAMTAQLLKELGGKP